MATWTRLAARIAIPVIYIFLLNTLLSPLPPSDEPRLDLSHKLIQFLDELVGIPEAKAQTITELQSQKLEYAAALEEIPIGERAASRTAQALIESISQINREIDILQRERTQSSSMPDSIPQPASPQAQPPAGAVPQSGTGAPTPTTRGEAASSTRGTESQFIDVIIDSRVSAPSECKLDAISRIYGPYLLALQNINKAVFLDSEQPSDRRNSATIGRERDRYYTTGKTQAQESSRYVDTALENEDIKNHQDLTLSNVSIPNCDSAETSYTGTPTLHGILTFIKRISDHHKNLTRIPQRQCIALMDYTATLFTNICSTLDTAIHSLGEKNKADTLKYFEDAPYFGGTESWGLRANVDQILSEGNIRQCEIKYKGNPENHALEFKSITSCRTHENKYNDLLVIRNWLTDKTRKTDTEQDIICQAWSRNHTAAAPKISDLHDESVTPQSLLPIPEVETPTHMKALYARCQHVEFSQPFTAEKFKSVFIQDGDEDKTGVTEVSLYDAKVSSVKNLLDAYVKEIEKSYGLYDGWLVTNENINSVTFLNLKIDETDFITKEFKENNSGEYEFSRPEDTWTNFSLIQKLYFAVAEKCFASSTHKQGCKDVNALKKNLPYPFGAIKVGEADQIHPHVLQGLTPEEFGVTSGHPFGTGNALTYIMRAFVCLARESGDQSAYALSYGLPGSSLTTGSKDAFAGRWGGCTVPNSFSPRNQDSELNTHLNLSQLDSLKLFAIGPGVLRTSTGLIALNELRREQEAKTTGEEHQLFRLSLKQKKFEKRDQSPDWQKFVKDKARGLSDIDFQKVILFFGSRLKFPQEGGKMPAPGGLDELKSEDGTLPTVTWDTGSVENLLKQIMEISSATEPFSSSKDELGNYMNQVKVNWVDKIVVPFYHTYVMVEEEETPLTTRGAHITQSNVFKLMFGQDPKYPPMMVNYETGEAMDMIRAAMLMSENPGDKPFVYLPPFMIDDYFGKDKLNAPIKGIFPSAKVDHVLDEVPYGLTQDDVFIGYGMEVTPGADVIAGLQTYALSVGHVIHRECAYKDNNFIQLMNRTTACMNDPKQTYGNEEDRALMEKYTEINGKEEDKRSPEEKTWLASNKDKAEQITRQTPAERCQGDIPPSDVIRSDGSVDMCLAFAKVQTHFDELIKGQDECSWDKSKWHEWVPLFKCSWQSNIYFWIQTIILTLVFWQLMVYIFAGENVWFWEFNKYKTRWGKSKTKKHQRRARSAAQQKEAQAAELKQQKLDALKKQAEEEAKTALPSYLRSGTTQFSPGNIPAAPGSKPAQTDRTDRTKTYNTTIPTPQFNFNIGPGAQDTPPSDK